MTEARAKLSAVVGVLLLCTGCTTTLSKSGQAVQVVTDQEKTSLQCQSLGVVTASNAWGWSDSGNLNGTMNQLRNKVAKMGGNGMRLMTSHNSAWTGASGVVEALDCPSLRSK